MARSSSTSSLGGPGDARDLTLSATALACGYRSELVIDGLELAIAPGSTTALVELAQDTSTLLLDEPTTFLDVGHQLEVMELIVRLHRE